MTVSDTTERGLERLICTALTGQGVRGPLLQALWENRAVGYGGVGWSCGNPHDYDREYCVDLVQLSAFLRDTQPEAAEALTLSEEGPVRRAFLTRLQGEISKRGTIDVLRNGIKHQSFHLDLFYGTPVGRQPAGTGTVRAEPLYRHAAASLQPGRGAAGAGHRAVH